jgi:hypothetical protein
MIEGLDDLLEGNGQLGLPELRNLLQDLLAEPGAAGQLIDQHRLKPCVYRLRFEINGHVRSLVVKRLDPDIAQRNRLVAKRWLPAVGLSQSGPTLLGTAAERSGQCVWHVYEDLGDWTLDASNPGPSQVKAAVELIAQIHIRFAGHALLGECRLWGGDLGIHFYTASVRDAINALQALRPPAVELYSGRLVLRERLLERMHKLLDEQSYRAQAMAELGGPETLLHGDLWRENVFVSPTRNGLQVRLIDWDHAAVGPISYDLSTFLLRFPTHDRHWILACYQDAVCHLNWRLPASSDLNLLFDTAECARLANTIIWPAIAVLESQAAWAFDQLAAIEEWFEMLEPVLPLSKTREASPR